MPYKNKDDEKARSKRYYQEHREAILAYKNLFHLKHKEEKNAYCREYDKRNIKVKQRRAREYNQKLKRGVLTHYGNGKLACVKCGFGDIRALSIDHINGGGEKDRKLGKYSGGMYRWLKGNNYPLGYQTLCMNCQFVKRDERKECNKV